MQDFQSGYASTDQRNQGTSDSLKLKELRREALL